MHLISMKGSLMYITGEVRFNEIAKEAKAIVEPVVLSNILKHIFTHPFTSISIKN